MSNNTIDVGSDFYHRLVNRNKKQGDGKHTAIDFREKYLTEFDNLEEWKSGRKVIVLDFSGVEIIGPSFANEAFGYFKKYASKEMIEKRFIFEHLDEVHKRIIDTQLAYKK